MRKTVLALMAIVAALSASLAPLAGRTQAQDAPKLRMGLLPILDVLPFYVADEAGYFAEEGV